MRGNNKIKEFGQKTQFKKGNKSASVPRRPKPIKELLGQMLVSEKIDISIAMTKDGIVTTKEVSIENKSGNIEELIAATLISKAIQGDLKAVQEVLLRVHGKPDQTLNVDIKQPTSIPVLSWAETVNEFDVSNQQEI